MEKINKIENLKITHKKSISSRKQLTVSITYLLRVGLMLVDSNLVHKALVILAIEKTLLTIGGPTYDKVIHLLEKEYRCGLTSCYEHPEYLTDILQKLYGAAYKEIIKSINEKLTEFSYTESIRKFVQVLNQ